VVMVTQQPRTRALLIAQESGIIDGSGNYDHIVVSAKSFLSRSPDSQRSLVSDLRVLYSATSEAQATLASAIKKLDRHLIILAKRVFSVSAMKRADVIVALESGEDAVKHMAHAVLLTDELEHASMLAIADERFYKAVDSVNKLQNLHFSTDKLLMRINRRFRGEKKEQQQDEKGKEEEGEEQEGEESAKNR